jgi:hypothetical protein
VRSILIGAAALALLGLVAGAFAVQRLAGRRWDAMTSWIASTQRAWDARDFRRAALHGSVVPGSAFERYTAALAYARELQADHDRLVALWHRPETLAAGEAERLRARWAPAVAAMREGAHREDARRPVRFDAGVGGQAIADLLGARWIVNTTVLDAREHLAAGAPQAAVEATLDAATFGADLVGSPIMVEQIIGIAMVAIATGETWTDARLAELDAEALTVLANGLRGLDAWLAPGLCLQGEVLLFAHSLDVPARKRWHAWRYAFSTRWMTADAVLEVAAALDRSGAISAARWPQRQALVERLNAELAASPNTIVRSGFSHLLTAEQNLRHALASLRMLRIAVDLRRGLGAPLLDDPLGGGALQVVETGTGLVLWSEGTRRNGRLQRAVALPSPR